jgi:hypothetical protein
MGEASVELAASKERATDKRVEGMIETRRGKVLNFTKKKNNER